MNALGILIFDMDGTLIDSMGYHADAFSKILSEEYNIPSDLSKEVYLSTAGQPIEEQFNWVFSRYQNDRVTNITHLVDRFWSIIQEFKPILFPDVYPAIKTLWQAGYTLIVSSSCTPSIVATKIREAGMARYFRLILGTNNSDPNMYKGKGHFKIIRDELFIDVAQFRANSAVVGDGKFDIKIAKEEGIIAIGRLTNYNLDAMKKTGADLLVYNLGQIVDLLCKQFRNSTQFMPIFTLRVDNDML